MAKEILDNNLIQALEKAKKPTFESEREMKDWATKAPVARIDGVKVILGLIGRNKPYVKSVIMGKIFNTIFGSDLTLLPNFITIGKGGGVKSSDSINAVNQGRTLDFKYVMGSDLKIVQRAFDGLEQGDDVFIITNKARNKTPIEKLLEHGLPLAKKIREGDHYVFVLDRATREVLGYSIKKETDGSISFETRRLNEETRSRSRQLNGNIFEELVKAGNRIHEGYDSLA